MIQSSNYNMLIMDNKESYEPKNCEKFSNKNMVIDISTSSLSN